MKTTHLQKQLPEAQHQKPMMAANAVVVVDVVVAAAVKVAAKAVAVAVAVMIATNRKPKKAMS
jgi:spore coat protein CotF